MSIRIIACFCTLSSELGLGESALSSFRRIRQVHLISPKRAPIVRDEVFEIPSINGTIVLDESSQQYMLFADGSLELIFDLCSDYWNGEELIPFDDTVRQLGFLLIHFDHLLDEIENFRYHSK